LNNYISYLITNLRICISITSLFQVSCSIWVEVECCG